jgi:hypothetical protein
MGPSRHQAKVIQENKSNVKEQCQRARSYIELNGCSKQVAIDTLELTISRFTLGRYKPDDHQAHYVHSAQRILTENGTLVRLSQRERQETHLLHI